MTDAVIEPGAAIGIIGGGQLGRMLAVAASELGYRVHIYTDEKESPASQVSAKTAVAAYDDAKHLKAFAEEVDVITFEFENIPYESLLLLEGLKPVRPGAEVLKTCRNRVREKSFINALGIATAPWRRVTSQAELEAAISALGLPCVLKTTELGYDGKGQMTLRAAADVSGAFAALNTPEAILEAFVDFTMEISVIVACNGAQTIAYTPVQNIHKHHILDVTIAPAPMNGVLSGEAESVACRIAASLNLQGLLAVEMFVTRDHKVLVNELAPRPHNSGHWTMDACITGQFEQAIRAVCGLSLGDATRVCDAEMKNLIGDEVKGWKDYTRNPHAKLHLYGKKEIRQGRKMGHVTFLKR